MNQGNDSAFFESFLNHSESLDFQKVLKVIISRWYWLAVSFFFFGLCFFLLIKLIKPEFVASVNLKYFDKQTELDEITSAKPTYLINNGSSEYLTEKYNIKSQEVVENAIRKLNYPFTFYILKDFRRIDIYPQRPLTVKILTFDESTFEKGKFILDPVLKITYQTDLNKQSFVLFTNAVITVPGLSFQIQKIDIREKLTFEMVFNNPSALAKNLIKRIEVNEVEETMPVLAVSFKYHNKPFAKDFLEKLLESYQTYDLLQKQQSSDLTLHFITDQIKVYSDSLKEAAHKLEVFKQHNAVLDISASAVEISEKKRDLEQQKNESEIQKTYILMLEKTLGSTFEQVNYLSVGLDGTTDAVLLTLLEQFNSLVSKRKDLLLKYSTNASAVKNLDEELTKYRKQILDNISLQKRKNAGVIQILSRNIESLQKRFRQIPAMEKNFIYLQSNFEVNKNIYSLLLNKEIESSIIRAGILPSFRLITLMEIDKTSPKPLQIATLCTFLSFVVALSAIFSARLFNKKFTDINLINTLNHLHLLGIINRFPEKITNGESIGLNKLTADQTVFTESVSLIRTRLSFLKKDEKLHPENGKQILITSEKSGEGKTFISLNLALSLTKIGKKVIVIGCDLRNSKLHHFFNDSNENGLSNYLQNKTDLNNLIKTSSIPLLDYILSGPPPFNPAELLQRDVFQELLTHCRKNYDYVFLDSAPVGLVSDNIPLLRESHFVIFILRWLYSDKDAYRLPEQLSLDYETDKIQVIVNDFYPDDLYNSVTENSSYSNSYQYNYQGNSYFKKKNKNIIAKVKQGLGLTHL